ncbi:MAG: hypothetical protein AAB370_03070, partial [Verrucomicrobiota bacterium]
DQLRIWPVCWGYPDSLVTDHPDAVEQMRLDHFAGMHELIDGNYTWPYWLERYGKSHLWDNFHTADMELRWLNWHNGPGSALFLNSGDGAGSIRREVLEQIRFRADFYIGARTTTIYLAECAPAVLTEKEREISPTELRKRQLLEDLKGKNLAVEMKLVAKERDLEAERSQRLAVEKRQARQEGERPVTRADCCEALKVGDRQLRNLCERFELNVPETQRQLDVLLAKHRRHKRTVGESATRRLKAATEKRRASR